MFPNLDHAKTLAIDIETHDPFLKTLGPGVRRKDGKILGVALADADREWYFPWNDQTKHFLFDLRVKDFITQNGLYDYDWMSFIPKGKMFDTKVAEALIDSNKFQFNLDSLAKKYLKQSKGDDEITAYAEARGWLTRGHKAQEFLKDMPAELVGKYAMKDVRQEYDIFHKQLPILEEMNLMKIFDIETRLLKPVLQMIRNGVRIDEEKLEMSRVFYKKQQENIESEIQALVGQVNLNSNKQLYDLYKRKGWDITYVEKDIKQKNGTKIKENRPSFDKIALSEQNNPLAPLLIQYRKVDKLRNSFVEALPKFIVNGRIHPLINTVKGDLGGTETGRFSYYNPNL